MEKKTVSLSLKTLIRECSLDSNLTMDHFAYFSTENRNNIHDVFTMRKFNDDFVDRLDCFNDGNHLIGRIRPSYDVFLRKLVFLLNLPVQGKLVDDEKLTNQLLERVERLKHVTSERELRMEFPLLYDDLMAGRRYYHDLQKMKAQEGYNEEEYASGEHYFYSCGLQKSLDRFVKYQSTLYTRLVTQRGELKQKQQQMSFNKYIRANFNMDKLYMYVMHEYLVKAESSRNRVEVQKYISLVEQYIQSDKNKKVSITTDSGQKIDYQNILNRLQNLKRFVHDKSSQVEWVLIPSGRDYSKVRKDSESSHQAVLMDLEEYLRLCQKGEKKTTFYASSPYSARVIGLEKFRGYIGYIYDNGEVILDTEFIPEKPSTAEGNAIYNLKVGDFELLSQCDKQHLRKHPKVGVINHSKTWEDRITKIIERKASPAEQEATKQLIKRLEEKSES